MSRSLNPIASVLFMAWLFASLLYDRNIEVGVATLALAVYTSSIRRLYLVYVWVAIPSLLMVWVLLDFETALMTAYRVLVIVMGTSSALLGVKPLELAWLLSRPPMPPIVGFIVPIILRIADFMLQSVYEVIAAMRGRGVTGRLRLLVRAPIPLVVFAFNTSLYLAETMHFKYPSRSRTWTERPRFKAVDYSIVLGVLVHLIFLILL
uniref:Energy-coupling factor transporter transmembrane protein EcfT n=1 Tax=Fervidicoccus fontis TaxID=683846 RepID=A0A7J3ZJX5_9CREN